MLKKSNSVLHFKIQSSVALNYFKITLNLVVFLLIVFSSLEWVFKVLLLLLLMLEYRRQQSLVANENNIIAIETRDNKVFLMRKNDQKFQAIKEINIKQNRIFTELELHLNDEVRCEFMCSDRFTSKYNYCSLMQNLRFNR